MICIC